MKRRDMLKGLAIAPFANCVPLEGSVPKRKGAQFICEQTADLGCRIVGMTPFDGGVMIATENGVCYMLKKKGKK